MEPKKISFGFMKTKKADKSVVEERKDYIECVEEKAIKVVGGEINTEKPALVIPMKPNTLVTAERLREIAEKVEKDVTDETQPQIKTEPENDPIENETLDQMAVRELLQDAKKDVKVEISELTVPIPAKVVLEGEKESTLEDYESVPIQDFGMAMLRGMGWTPGKDGSKYKLPELRPKGLGLGADKVVKDNQKKNVSKNKNDEELSIVKNAFVKIVTGKHSGCYGKVVSLDEDNGRVMVDIPIKKDTVSLSEFMLQPVTKTEFDKESRVINQDTYEEYKKREKQPNSSRHESPNAEQNLPSSSRKERKEDYRDNRSSNGNSNKKRRDSSSEERYNRKTDDSVEKRSEENRKTNKDDSVERDRRTKNRDRSEERVREIRYSSSEERDYRKTKRGDIVERDRRTKNRDKSDERMRKRRDSSSEQRDYRKTKRDDSEEKYHKKKNRDKSKERSKKRIKSTSPERGSRKRKDKKKYSSNESLDSLSDEKKRTHKSKSRKNSHSDTESDDYKKNKRRSKTPEGKRDIDKKRKGKKKKRDRDRSPNYKKHRK